MVGWKGDRSELESLLGKLLHVSEVLRMARPFLKRIRRDMLRYPRGASSVKLNRKSWKDWEWWQEVLTHWVGTSLFTSRDWRCSADLKLQTDASGTWGCGAVWESHWMTVPWKWSERTKQVVNIAVLELIPIVLAAEAWGSNWSRLRIEFQTDTWP